MPTNNNRMSNCAFNKEIVKRRLVLKFWGQLILVTYHIAVHARICTHGTGAVFACNTKVGNQKTSCNGTRAVPCHTGQSTSYQCNPHHRCTQSFRHQAWCRCHHSGTACCCRGCLRIQLQWDKRRSRRQWITFIRTKAKALHAWWESFCWCSRKFLDIQGWIQDFGKGRGGPTMKDSEMSRRSWRGDTEGIAGGECERGLNPLLLGGSGGPPPENFQYFGAFSCNLGRHSSALLPGLLIQAYYLEETANVYNVLKFWVDCNKGN